MIDSSMPGVLAGRRLIATPERARSVIAWDIAFTAASVTSSNAARSMVRPA